MLGQAPYVINGMVSYNSDKLGITASLSYNVQGPRLVIVGASSIPDVFEMPRNLLDFKASKSLGKHFGLSLKVFDILNAPFRRSYYIPKDYNVKDGSGYIVDFDKYTWGTSYTFAVTYKL